MTVTDTYKAFPTRAPASEGCTPSSSTCRLREASPVPSSIWGGDKAQQAALGRGLEGALGAGVAQGPVRYHNAREGLGQ